MDRLNRIVPHAGPEAYKTYAIRAPLATHWRPATCEEVNCEAWLSGWRTIVPAGSPQADYIRADKSREHAEASRDGGLACFSFPPGQTCFAAGEHKTRLAREERFLEIGGDWRGNPRHTATVERSPADWTDSFATHQDRLKTVIDRG